MESKFKKIGWKVSGLSPDLASVRYRAILPILALKETGIDFTIFSSAMDVNLNELDALVIVKSFTPEDLFLVQQASVRNIPVFFDLCDNIFIEEYKGKQIVTPAEIFNSMVKYLAGVLVTTVPLKDVVETAVGSSLPVFVVPDGVETNKDIESAKEILKFAAKDEIKKGLRNLLNISNIYKNIVKINGKQKIKTIEHYFKSNLRNQLRPIKLVKNAYRIYDSLRSSVTGQPRKIAKPAKMFSSDTYEAGIAIRKIPANKKIKRVLWFGNHGAKYAQFGILDLLQLRSAIEKLNKEIPIELIVVSNNREKYLKYISRFECVSRYVEWSPKAVDDMLAIADAVVIPNSKDAFSICKSSNRTVLSINANVPVVADMTPALEDFYDAIYVDDFYTGLKECFTNQADVENKILLGKERIEKKYSKQAIANIFFHVFKNYRRPTTESNPDNPIVILLHLIQDLDLAKPLIDKFKESSTPLVVLTSFSLVSKSAKVLQYLDSQSVKYYCLPDDILTLDAKIFNIASARSLISMAETNLAPHRFTHAITQLANKAGVRTFTMQHGFENVGLTYSDSVQDIKKIKIASRRICIWGKLDTLHPDVRPEIKKRVLPVGCPKNSQMELNGQNPLDSIEATIIGIFENLHWHRYSQEYRDNFLNAIEIAANKYPDVKFFIKPHPAGMWLTSRYKGKLPESSNIIIANPTDTQWKNYSINDFWRNLSAVISTPSTVVMDAAVENLPVLVCAYDLSLDNFEPLALAKDEKDWLKFIDRVVRGKVDEYKVKNKSFLKRILVKGDALEKITKLLSHANG